MTATIDNLIDSFPRRGIEPIVDAVTKGWLEALDEEEHYTYGEIMAGYAALEKSQAEVFAAFETLVLCKGPVAKFLAERAIRKAIDERVKKEIEIRLVQYSPAGERLYNKMEIMTIAEASEITAH